ncbi:MAG TPA: SDR family NAD(P)-dependent oxidoreductase, partial [Acetobacteraceae bacterium]|nr:SDR family NAD(P)-dependent oxidoreductase [Acetobacteraceae bacterium]
MRRSSRYSTMPLPVCAAGNCANLTKRHCEERGDEAISRQKGRNVMAKLEGKVALVTGSGRNIGRATVLKLAAEGADVMVNARSNQAEADAVVREARALGVKALAIVADVASKEQVEAMAAKALSEFGRVDILINNAAIRPHKAFTELTAQDWETVRGVVLDGAIYL